MAALAAPIVSPAAQLWWDGSSSSSWGTAANWSAVQAGGSDPAAAPGSADDAIFSAGSVAGTSQTIHLAANNRSLQSLTVNFAGSTQIDRASSANTSANTLTVGAGGIHILAGAGNVTFGDTLSTGQKVNVRASTSLGITHNSTSALTFNRTLDTSSAGNVTITLAGAGSGNVTFNDVIGNGTGGGVLGLAVNTAGTVVLAVNNSYAGGTTLTAGRLLLGGSSALGTGHLAVNGGSLASTGSARTLSNNVTVGGDFTLGGAGQSIVLNGALDLGGGNRTLTLANSATVGGLIFNGALTISSSTATRTFTLTNANTYAGGTTVSNGTLLAGNATGSATGSGPVAVASGATLGAVAGSSGSVSGEVSLASATLGNANSTLSLGGGLGSIGSSVIAANSTVNVAGVTSVSGGQFSVNGTLGGAGAKVFSGSATLAGSGVINGSTSVGSLAFVSPGSAGAGNLTVNGDLALSGTYVWNLAALSTTGAGTSYDTLTMGSGNLDLNGARMSLSLGAFAPSVSEAFWQTSQVWAGIVNNTGGGSISATFATIDNSAWAAAGAFGTQITGNDVDLVWTPIPEPAHAGLFAAMAALGFGATRRRWAARPTLD